NGSDWETTKDSLIDTLAINSGSQVNVSADSSLTSDTITLNGSSSMEVNGEVNTDHLIIDTFSTVNFGEDTASAWTSAPL
ncbi:hypothetical protein, partial [Escherichia coli]